MWSALATGAVIACTTPHAWVQTGYGQLPKTKQNFAIKSHVDMSGATAKDSINGGAATTYVHAQKNQASWLALAASLGALGAAFRANRRKFVRKCTTAEHACDDVQADDLEQCEEVLVEHSRREIVAGTSLIAAGSSAAPALAGGAGAEVDETWVQYDLNTGETLYDIDFDPEDPLHGFVVGARGLFYETKDGGKRWISRSFQNLSKGEEISYRFQNVSIKGKEVWIVGKPPLLLHSKDSGSTWKKVPVSRKLPGEPKVITALAEGKAEMATSSGAVYTTENDGKNWRSQIRETIDATLNRVSSSGVSGASYFSGSVKSLTRDTDGKYLAVAQRGNFYLTLEPGTPQWVPHNRISARRIQAMGFRSTANQEPAEGVWMSLNGGSLASTPDPKYKEMNVESKEIYKTAEIRTGGIGIIDIAFRTPKEAWAVGGSGVIYYTKDGGDKWQFDLSGNELPCNLYNVKFFDNGKLGFMIGSAGILLRKRFAA